MSWEGSTIGRYLDGLKQGKTQIAVSEKNPKRPQSMQRSNPVQAGLGLSISSPATSRADAKGSADTPMLFLGELVAKLDKIQDLIGMPVIVLSGTRCEKFGRKSGAESAQLTLSRAESATPLIFAAWTRPLRSAFLSAALPLFNRVGIGKESIHVDDDPEIGAERCLALLNKGVSMALIPDDTQVSDCEGRVGTIIDTARDLFNETAGGFLTDAFILRSINRCQQDIAQEDYWRRETWIPSVSGTNEIDLLTVIPQYQDVHQLRFVGCREPMTPRAVFRSIKS